MGDRESLPCRPSFVIRAQTTIMTIPRLCTQEALLKLAKPDETHEVHIIVRRIANQAPYTLRGRARQYIVQRDPKRAAHILRVPLSVWMDGVKSGTVVQNDSICYDIMSNRTAVKAPLTFEVWKVGADAPESEIKQPEAILELFETLVLRLAQANNPESYKQHLTPYLEKAAGRISQPPTVEMFKAGERTDILEFIERMDWLDPDEKSKKSAADQPEIAREADDGFLAILKLLNAPECVAKAYLMALASDVAALGTLHDEIKADLEKAPMTAAERQRKRREKLKADKEAKAKQLQPA